MTIAPNVIVLAHDASPKPYLDKSLIASVSIGQGAFIGAGSIVLPGVKIGEYAIIGAGSVVTKDVPDRCVAVGNPARVVSAVSQFIEDHEKRMSALPSYPKDGWTAGSISTSRKSLQRDAVENGGYVE